MRVMISADVEGGVWSYVACLATELASGGCSVLVAIVGSPERRHLQDLPPGVEVVARPFRLEWMSNPGADLDDAGEWLARTAREWQADVVHLNQLTYATHEFGAPTVVVVHSDVLSWFQATLGRPAPAHEWDEYKARVQASLQAATAVVAVSRCQADHLRREYRLPDPLVIHNGIDVEAPPGRSATARKGPSVLSTGRGWDLAKGIRVLDEAISLLGDSAPDAAFIGPTAGPNGESFTPASLRCVGTISRSAVPEWLSRATIYVAPAFYEPFGLAVLEAAAHGCALILSDIESFRELWSDCAIFVAPGDAVGLADAISTLMNDEALVRSLSLSARDRALRAYGAKRFANDYLSLYERLVASEIPQPLTAPSDLIECT